MLKTFLKIAWRNLVQHTGFTAINVCGLAIGITTCLIAGLFITDELRYDAHNNQSGQIYRVESDIVNEEGTQIKSATTPPAVAATAKLIPSIQSVTRVFPVPGHNFYVRFGNRKFVEKRILHVDSSFFSVFTVHFLLGKAGSSMIHPNSIILTATAARKYFGTDNPIGKSLLIDDWEPAIVTGIVEDQPEQSHFRYDFLVPLTRFMNAKGNSNWNWPAFYTYIKIAPTAAISDVDNKIQVLSKRSFRESSLYFHSQALKNIHLRSHLKDELAPNGDLTYVVVFAIVALCILLIATINYINIVTATCSFRLKEISVRKVSGAARTSLVGQFLTESVLTALLAMFISFAATEVLLPSISAITGKQLKLFPGGAYAHIVAVFIFSVLTGLVAGLVPALYLSSLSPLRGLTGDNRTGSKSVLIRKALVVAQFSIATMLIVSTLIISKQISYIQHAKLGLNKDNIIVVEDMSFAPDQHYGIALKDEWMKQNSVKAVASADGIVPGQNWSRPVRNKMGGIEQYINYLSIDIDFLQCLGIKLKNGKNVRAEDSTRLVDEIILNETAVKQLGLNKPVIGQYIIWRTDASTKQEFKAEVVGVVEDFHFASMKEGIKPFAFVPINESRRWNYILKVDGSNMVRALSEIQKVWIKLVPAKPFQYTFLDETYANLYASERHFKDLFLYITYISIFISCLGLFGLSSFMIDKRSKEIGIRKVLGASIPAISRLVATEFLTLIVIACLISIPCAALAMQYWLQTFAYRTSLSWPLFVFAAGISVTTGLITVLFQSIRAGMLNPVRTLRSR